MMSLRRTATGYVLVASFGLAACSGSDVEPVLGTGGGATGGLGGGATSGFGGNGSGGLGGAATGGGGEGGAQASCTEAELAAIEESMATLLDEAGENPDITTEPAFTLLLEAEDGRRFTHSHAGSTATTPYDSASTSKWVTATVILELVDQGVLSLDTKASDLISFWNDPNVELRHLLSFTSGYAEAPFCLNLPGADFATCAWKIYDDNVASPAPAGTEYEYESTHLQVAGLMAIEASGSSDWGEVFDGFKTRTGLFPNSVYDLPSAQNPRLAGGMTWTGEDYHGFLRALFSGAVLEDATRAELFADQRGSAVVVYSPVYAALGEDWSYGFGNWLECPTATQANSYDCGEGHRNSSPGAYGAYPFIDFDNAYFGILARQGTLSSAREGIDLFRSVESLAEQWAAKSCE